MTPMMSWFLRFMLAVALVVLLVSLSDLALAAPWPVASP